jgi:ribosome-associated protein
MDDFDNTSPPPKSKSQRKRELLSLQHFARQLVELKPVILEKMALTIELAEAIKHAQQIYKSHSAFKRQIQYLGGLLEDYDVNALQTTLASIMRPQQQATQFFKQAQDWRDRLLQPASATVLSEILSRFPQTDMQQLKKLLDLALREQAQGSAPHAKRRLFRYLLQILNEE